MNLFPKEWPCLDRTLHNWAAITEKQEFLICHKNA